MVKPRVLIIGKLPPPYYGPAIATKIILSSSLNEAFQLIHLNNTVNKSVADFGSWSLKKLWKNFRIYVKLISLLAKYRPTICLLPFSQSIMGFLKDSIFILVAAAFGSKVILQLRGSNFRNIIDRSNPMVRNYIRFCFNQTKAMIVLGENLKHLFQGYYQPEQIFVVPNGCDLDIPQNTNSTKIVKLLYFANYHQAKGIGDVINALLQLKQEGQANFHLDAVGAWSNKKFEEECKSLVKLEALPVTFNKPLSGHKKWKFFSEAEIFLFPPNKPEGHPWVIVEALAAGLPIISTDQGAIIESVIDGENGFIVESNDPLMIAQRLKQLLQDEDLRKKMGKASKVYYQRHFTEHKMVENLSKVFEQVISK